MTLGSGETNWSERALATASAIDLRLYVPTRGLYGTRQRLLGRRFEYLWPFACAWSAACSLGSVDRESLEAAHLSSYLRGLTSYHRNGTIDETGPIGFSSGIVSAYSSGGETYYDDNAWVALALLHEHDITGDELRLRLAQRIVEFVLEGWSTDDAWSHPGGIRWKQPVASTTRNTCSNGPVAEAAVELYEKTGDRHWLDWAIRIYRWVQTSLQTNERLYADHIEWNGTVEPTIWTYNQGTMVGAGTLLGKITGEESYFEDAFATANAALARFDLDELLDQPVSFNAVFLRNLLLFDSVRPDARISSLASDYGETMWEGRGIDDRTLFPQGSTGSVLNATVPLVEIYALLAGVAPRP